MTRWGGHVGQILAHLGWSAVLPWLSLLCLADLGRALQRIWRCTRCTAATPGLPPAAARCRNTCALPFAAAAQVETVRPGDKAVFTGMLVVVPDVAALT